MPAPSGVCIGPGGGGAASTQFVEPPLAVDPAVPPSVPLVTLPWHPATAVAAHHAGKTVRGRTPRGYTCATGRLPSSRSREDRQGGLAANAEADRLGRQQAELPLTSTTPQVVLKPATQQPHELDQ